MITQYIEKDKMKGKILIKQNLKTVHCFNKIIEIDKSFFNELIIGKQYHQNHFYFNKKVKYNKTHI